jgi:hypothetical protein
MSYFKNNPYGSTHHMGNFEAPQNVQAKTHMPSMSELGGQNQIPWVRFPYYPTSPFYSTDPNVGTQSRFYGATLTSADTDYQEGTEAIRTVQFDIPVRLIAVNASCTDVGTPVTAAAPNVNMLDSFLFRMEYTTGDRLNTAARLASTCVGTMENPGEIGGVGYTIDQGASLVLGLTPLACLPAIAGAVSIRIDITLVCLEIRGGRTYVS